MDDLEVDLGRGDPHTIDVVPSFGADGSFDVVLENHGAAQHVHLHLDDDLSAAAELATTNHYVEADRIQRVPVRCSEAALPAEGRLEIVTGYGSETEYVNVTIEEPDGTPSVDVDERLGEPRSTGSDPILEAEHLPLVALAAVALVIALLAAVFIGEVLVLLGVFVVLVGIVLVAVLIAR